MNRWRLENGRSLPSTRTLERAAKATRHRLTIAFTKWRAEKGGGRIEGGDA